SLQRLGQCVSPAGAGSLSRADLRAAGLSPDVRAAGLSPDVRAAGLSPDVRAAGLSRAGADLPSELPGGAELPCAGPELPCAGLDLSRARGHPLRRRWRPSPLKARSHRLRTVLADPTNHI